MAEEKVVRLVLSGGYSSTNVGELEQIFNTVTEPDLKVIVDMKEVTYISSAGLREFLKLKKRVSEVECIEVSREVYDIFEVTGFDSILTVKKALREISVDTAQELGHGASSAVYRIDPETIVKVYNEKIPYEKIARECELAKNAFIAGIPTIISYDTVKCDGKYGTLFELVDSEVLASYLNAHPEKFDEYADKYVAMAKYIHNTELPDTFMDIKDVWHNWVEMLSKWITDEEKATLHKLIDAVPAKKTMVHSDMHSNNVMIKDGELILIDMADVGRGHPVFDIGPLCFHYKWMEIANRELADNLMVLNSELRKKMWDKLKNDYLYDPDPDKHEKIVKIYDCFGAFRCGVIAAKHAQMPEENKVKFIKVMKETVFSRADEIIELIKECL